ncbi:hypothetical protein MXB_3730 [Myxobolus squamalis]|nr:hypothetical protein MXB_3730 [Myxobolus squamalis]
MPESKFDKKPTHADSKSKMSPDCDSLQALNRLDIKTNFAFDQEFEIVFNLVKSGKIDVNQVNSEGQSLLSVASSAGQISLVQHLLEKGAKPDHSGVQLNFTPLMNDGYADIANLLVAAGAKLDVISDIGNTPLMEAIKSGSLEIVNIILNKSRLDFVTKMTQPDTDGTIPFNEMTSLSDTPLSLACRTGSYEVAKLLLEQIASQGKINQLELFNALIDASIEGYIEIIKLLIQYGCDINILSPNYTSPLHLAANRGNLDLVKLFLDQGADVNYLNEHHITPLLEAARENRPEVFKELANRGADINYIIEGSNETALSLATLSGSVEIIKFLLESGATLFPAINFALIEAANCGSIDIITLYLSKGADVNFASPYTLDTPAAVACESGRLDIFKYLLQNGAKADCVDKSGYNLLIRASRSGHVNMVELLINLGINVNAKSKDNDHTALSFACMYGHFHVVKALINHGADPLHILKDNTTVMMHACRSGNKSIVNILLDSSLVFCDASTNLKTPQSNISIKNNDQEQNLKLISSEAIKLNSFKISAVPLESTNILTIPLDTSSGENVSSCFTGLEESLNQEGVVITSAKVGDQQTNLSQKTTIAASILPKSVVHIKHDTATNERITTVTFGTKHSQSSKLVSNNNLQRSIYVTKTTIEKSSEIASKNGKTMSMININAVSEIARESALSIACSSNHTEIALLLISKGALIECKDVNGYTPLMICCFNGNLILTRKLLDNNANIEAVCDKKKDSSLTIACRQNKLEIVRLLIERGANIEHTNINGYSPLMNACTTGFFPIFFYLLESGANINPTKQGLSPLIVAIVSDNPEMVKVLIDHGVDISVEHNRVNALTIAVTKEKPTIVGLLLEAKPNIENKSLNGFTPLMEAACNGNVEIGMMLIKAGADVNSFSVTPTRDTPLLIAAENGHYRFVDILLKNKSHVDYKNKKGCTAFWVASNNGFLEVIKVLINHNAAIDTVDGRECSALVAAIRGGHLELIKYLAPKATRFPTDNDCKKYLNSILNKDKNFYNTVVNCIRVVMDAKDNQELESQKAADDLIQMESEEKEKKLSAIKKRDKKKKAKAKPAPIVQPKNEIPPSLQKIPSKMEQPQKSQKIPKLPAKAIEKQEPEVSTSETDGWKQVVRKSSAAKLDTNRKVVRTQIPSHLVSRLIGKGGTSINSIREKTSTVIDIDTIRKNMSGECAITIKGQFKDIRTVLCIISVIIHDSERSTTSILGDLENIKRTYEPASYVNVTGLKDNRPIYRTNSPTSSRLIHHSTAMPITTTVSDPIYSDEIPKIYTTQVKQKNIEDDSKKIIVRETSVSLSTPSEPQTNVAWLTDINQSESRATLSVILDTIPTSPVTYPTYTQPNPNPTNLCPGAGRPIRKEKKVAENFSCPIWDALYDGTNKVGVCFDKKLWMETMTRNQKNADNGNASKRPNTPKSTPNIDKFFFEGFPSAQSSKHQNKH